MTHKLLKFTNISLCAAGESFQKLKCGPGLKIIHLPCSIIRKNCFNLYDERTIKFTISHCGVNLFLKLVSTKLLNDYFALVAAVNYFEFWWNLGTKLREN